MAKPLEWVGPKPKPQLERVLATAGYAIAKQGARIAVVCTVDARSVPSMPIDRPWIWLVQKAVSDAIARAATAAGAYEVLSTDEADLGTRLVSRLRELEVADAAPTAPPTAIAGSPVARRVLDQIARAARTSMPVLITGETGTGKEVTARLIHAWSARSKRTFVPINCAAIPNDLMEGELFGYARGAFSGAVRTYDGALVAAEGGTVFLDEIDDTPLPTQVKLLRVLEDRVVTRLGETSPHQVDFRILAATNRDLKKLIAQGQFGADLYERLAIVHIQLPPLRERLDDLPQLVEFFMARYFREEPDARTRAPVTRVSPRALRALAEYPWPGNIRELRNVVFEALVYKRAGDELLLSDLPKRILVRDAASTDDAGRIRALMDAKRFNLRAELEALERAALKEALARTGGNMSEAARLLGEVGRGSARQPGDTVRAMIKRLRLRA